MPSTIKLSAPKRSLLFLCHRIPYPPDKGEKIRAFRILEHLAASFDIHLGFLVDDVSDMAHMKALDAYCDKVCGFLISPRTAKLRAFGGLLRHQALSVASFSNARMRHWVTDVLLREKPDVVFLYSSAMAQFVMNADLRGAALVMDFVDVDSDKWRQYACTASPPMKWIYAREADLLLQFDRRVAAQADSLLFVSNAEADLFKSLAPAARAKIHAVSNGIDCDYFSPAHAFPTPFSGYGPHLVFTGTMDYWPNVDAVIWFATEIFPLIRNFEPTATFTIVGAKPTDQVNALAARPGVNVTGRVPDVRPYMSHAAVIVAPLRIARGIQNKILEGMAMAKPVITTPQGLEGIDATHGRHLLVADTPDSFSAAVLHAMISPSQSLGPSARDWMELSYTWAGRMAALDEFVM